MVALHAALHAAPLILALLSYEIVREDPPERWLSPEGILYLLGGVEGDVSLGSAEVWSDVRREDGTRETIASGNAPARALGLSLYMGPRSTGFHWRPVAGWLTQDIAIADVTGAQPQAPSSASGTDIGAQCSDPDTGSSVPCNAPNDYDLSLSSLYAGGLVGYDVVVDIEGLRLLGGLRANVNIVERRTIEVALANDTLRHREWTLFRSLGLEATTGVAFPDLHFAVRASVAYRRHGGFSFGESIEFQGPPRYDAERDIYVRRRVLADSASLGSTTARLGVAYLF